MATSGNEQLDRAGAEARELKRLRYFGLALLAALALICVRVVEMHWEDAAALVRLVGLESSPSEPPRPDIPAKTAGSQPSIEPGSGTSSPTDPTSANNNGQGAPIVAAPPEGQHQEPTPPKPRHAPVPAPPEATRPAATAPAPPKPPVAREFEGFKLRNDSAGGHTVHCLVDGKVVTLAPGEEQAFAGAGPWTIGFHRGGEFGAARYRLTRGEFAFRATSKGWGLFRKPKARP